MINSKVAFSENEKKLISEIKRLSEWLQADSALRKRLCKGKGFTPEDRNWLCKIGVKLDTDEASFLWKYPDEVAAYLMIAAKEQETDMPDRLKEIVNKYPLLELWAKHSNSRNFITKAVEQWSYAPSENGKFGAWRKRRVAASKSELGYLGMQIGHPAFAFELSEGCSIGCWFCSFAAIKLSANLDYPKEKDEVLSIIRQCGKLFGNTMISMSLPYYRTEPHDNPYYLDFIKDFEKEIGAVLCTSTAVCNDINWIKELLSYYQNRKDGTVYYWPRLSILSLPVLKKIHTAFTPMEIKDIDLLIQVKDHERPKVTGGRILKEQAGLRGIEDFSVLDRSKLAASIPQGTIACVSGFNINLVSRKIMIFSPCYTSEKWPHGFRVFGETSYTDESDFGEAITGLVDKYMISSPPMDEILRFRDDIIYHPTEEGFDLATPHQLHHFKGKSKYGPLGQLISEGTYTYSQIFGILLEKHKVNPIVLRMIVQQLFDDGYIDEIYEKNKNK